MNSMKNRSQKMKILPSAMIGNAVSIFVCLCAALICPIFILNETFDAILMKMMVNIIQGMAAFAGVLVAGHITEDKKWITAILCGGVFAIVLIACAVLFFEIDATAIIRGLLSSILGTVCALLIVVRRKKAVKNKRFNRRSR